LTNNFEKNCEKLKPYSLALEPKGSGLRQEPPLSVFETSSVKQHNKNPKARSSSRFQIFGHGNYS